MSITKTVSVSLALYSLKQLVTLHDSLAKDINIG